MTIVLAVGLLGSMVPTASASTTIPVFDRNVQMNLFLSGRTVTSVSIQAFGGNWSGDSAVKWTFHGRRTVTGGQSQAIGAQEKAFGVCVDASLCFKSFKTGFPFTYACGDWVYADIWIQNPVTGKYDTTAGTPVFHFNHTDYPDVC